jgi:hypothetical protein
MTVAQSRTAKAKITPAQKNIPEKCRGEKNSVEQNHSWAPIAKKTLIRSMVLRSKKILNRWLDSIFFKKIFKPMIDTNGQK